MRIARGISVTNTSKPIGITYDADAVAFFTAASITDTTQKSAVNTLVLSLKSANIWTKMKALYPVVGGVASAHAINLKQPGTFNLAFTTGWTHASTGMTPNGAAYANTFLKPSVSLSLNSTHISSYIRNSSQGVLLGVDSKPTAPGTRLWISPNFNGTNRYIQINTDSTIALTPVSNSLGLWLGSRTSSISSKLYYNNSINITSSEASSGLDVNEIILAARNLGTSINNYSSSQISFASIGDGLTDAEASSFYSAVQTYQTTLGRQV